MDIEVRTDEGEAAAPSVGRVDFGDFDHRSPIGHCYGFDRGQPLDRWYIERFLARHAHAIRGRVLGSRTTAIRGTSVAA
jgi:hypothetical protein